MTVLDKTRTRNLVAGGNDNANARIDIGLMCSLNESRIIEQSLSSPQRALESTALLFQLGAHSAINGEGNTYSSKELITGQHE